MNKLFAFGDSFTWGNDLGDMFEDDFYEPCTNLPKYDTLGTDETDIFDEFGNVNWGCRWNPDYSTRTWTALLSNDMGMKYKCYAESGSSNQTIFRELLNQIHTIDGGDLVVINWTWINRWDFYNSEDTKWETLRPTGTSNSKFNNIYFKYLQSELWDKLETLKVITLAINTLNSKNIKFLMTCIDELIMDKKFHSPPYIEVIQSIMDDDILWFDNKGFYNWSIENNYPISDVGGHPLEEAHQMALKYIKKNHDFT